METSPPPIVGLSVQRPEAPGNRYAAAVVAAGGFPRLLPHEPNHAAEHLHRLDALILTGGDDPTTEAFGRPTHPAANRMDPVRQAFELALLQAAERDRPDLPVLGICLGLQLMALHAGGHLHQHLPEILIHPDEHRHDHRHPVCLRYDDSPLGSRRETRNQVVASAHRQAVADPGSMRRLAHAPDGVLEAADDPHRRWYLGVQWHPERSGGGPLADGLFRHLIAVAEHTPSPRRERDHALALV